VHKLRRPPCFLLKAIMTFAPLAFLAGCIAEPTTPQPEPAFYVRDSEGRIYRLGPMAHYCRDGDPHCELMIFVQCRHIWGGVEPPPAFWVNERLSPEQKAYCMATGQYHPEEWNTK
jgi:hypothetical protein